MQNTLSKTFTAKSIILYAFPTIVMMIFMSVYTIVDGIFVARFVNEDAFASINIVYPILSFTAALALMLSTGANAIIGKLLGEGNVYTALKFFTLVYIVGATLGVILTITTYTFPEQVLSFLGTTDKLYPYAKEYFMMYVPFMSMFLLQIFTQSFFITAGKPSLGFVTCFIGGVFNIIFDYVFIVIFEMGISGAALATGLGFTIPGLFGVIYFSVARHSPLHFVLPSKDFKLLFMAMFNGMSEFVTSISVAITTLMFNLILLDIAGEAGVAAISAILYVQMIQSSIYMGYAFGVSPVISYKFGEKNHDQLRKIMKTSMLFTLIVSIFTILASIIFSELAVSIFISPNSSTFDMAVTGFEIYSANYIFMGLNIFISSMFTAFSNGKVSALLSFLRTFAFLLITLLTLPQILGIIGVWLAVPIAEGITLILSLLFYFKYSKKYNYLKDKLAK